MKIDELEATLLDQIEKLNQDDVMTNSEEADRLIARSKVMSDLTGNIIEI